LIVGAGDGRHIISTISESGLNAELLILEQNLMTYARQILFLTLVQVFIFIIYRVSYGFGQAKFVYGGSILGSSQFYNAAPDASRNEA